MSVTSGPIKNINKKVILPVGITASPALLGNNYKINLHGTEVIMYLPKTSLKKAVGIDSPLQPPAPYVESGLSNWDKELEGAWLQWGTNISMSKNEITSSKIEGIILTIDGPFNGAAQLDAVLNTIDFKFMKWYRFFANWVELLTNQDLNQASSDVVMTDENLQEFWTAKLGENTVRAETTDTIMITGNINTYQLNLDEEILFKAIDRANQDIDVSFENKILIDAKRKMNREDYSGSCLYFGQYIEATARKRLRQYLEENNVAEQIIDEFLEKRALANLLQACKRFEIDLGISNKERESILQVRNKSAHAREIMNASEAKKSRSIADKVFVKNYPDV